MRRKIIVVENKKSHFSAIAAQLRKLGYVPVMVSTVEEAAEAAKAGFHKFLLDIRLANDSHPHDRSGMRGIKRIREANASACVLVYSGVAAENREDALELGAWEVVAKGSDAGAAAAVIHSHFTRFDASKTAVAFALKWIFLPITIANAVAWAVLETGLSFPFLSRDASVFLPFVGAAVFVLLASYSVSARQPAIAESEFFRKFGVARKWLLGAMTAGAVYDLVYHGLKSLFP